MGFCHVIYTEVPIPFNLAILDIQNFCINVMYYLHLSAILLTGLAKMDISHWLFYLVMDSQLNFGNIGDISQYIFLK